MPADSYGSAGTIIETDPPSGGDPVWIVPTKMSAGSTEMTTVMKSKGRVTVQKTVREFLGFGPDSTIDFELMLNGEVVTRAAATGRRPQRGRFARSRGRATLKLSADEMLALTRGA